MEAAANAVKKGVVVVRSSTCANGTRSAGMSRSTTTSSGFIASDELNPQKSRILLSLALLQKRTPEQIQELFYTY